jgi:hypothetical protein
LGAVLRGHAVGGQGGDLLEELGLAGAVALDRGEASEADPGLDEALSGRFGLAEGALRLLTIAELALGDLGEAQPEIGGEGGVALATLLVGEAAEELGVARRLAAADRLIAGGLVQRGAAGGVLEGAQAQLEGLLGLALALADGAELAEDLGAAARVLGAGEAVLEEPRELGVVAVGLEGALELARVDVVLEGRDVGALVELARLDLLAAARREAAELVLDLGDADRGVVAGVAADRQQEGAVGPLRALTIT